MLRNHDIDTHKKIEQIQPYLNEKTSEKIMELVNEPFSIDNVDSQRFFSNLELSLLNTITVDYCRLEQMDEAKKYFELIQTYLFHVFRQSHYATNRNNQFEVKFLANHVCNYFLFFRDTEDFPIDIIDNALTIRKQLSNHHMLPELLLCKCYLLMQD